MSGEWSYGLYSCFGDCTLCIITLLLPCYTAGKNAEAVGEDSILHAIAYMVPILNIFSRTTIRGKIRETKGIAGSTCDDCLTVTFSSIISLVQEARELKEPGGQSMAQE